MPSQEEIEKKEARKCVKCETPIPDDFVNPLCTNCYKKLEEENKKKVEEKKAAEPQVKELKKHKNGITEETYIEHPEAEDKEQWEANIAMFRKRGVMLWHPTKNMYTFIRDYARDKAVSHPQYPKFIWKPSMVDVGCGCGVGLNILSQEADFVWGIDKNEGSIKFAKECFTRVKNHIYYSSQITFDHLDILTDTREFKKFDLVVAIEVIEHIDDYKGFLKMISRFDNAHKKGWNTEYFISTPNRNNKYVGDHGPKNKFHVREWTSGEYFNVLKEFFNKVEFYNSKGEEIPLAEYETTQHTPLLAKCSK